MLFSNCSLLLLKINNGVIPIVKGLKCKKFTILKFANFVLVDLVNWSAARKKPIFTEAR